MSSQVSKGTAIRLAQQEKVSPRLAEAEYTASQQEPWEVADDLDAEKELNAASERERFEQTMDMLAYQLDGLMP